MEVAVHKVVVLFQPMYFFTQGCRVASSVPRPVSESLRYAVVRRGEGHAEGTGRCHVGNVQRQG